MMKLSKYIYFLSTTTRRFLRVVPLGQGLKVHEFADDLLLHAIPVIESEMDSGVRSFANDTVCQQELVGESLHAVNPKGSTVRRSWTVTIISKRCDSVHAGGFPI